MHFLFRRLAIGCIGLAAAAQASAQIELYQDDNYGGQRFNTRFSITDLASTGFNDKASSVIVRGGQWQICSDNFFNGSCVTLGPGSYPALRPMGLNDKVSSVRSLGWTPDGRGGWTHSSPRNDGYNSDGRDGNQAGHGAWENPDNNASGGNGHYGHNQSWGNGGGNWGTGARAVLYQDINLSGRAVPIDPRGVNNLKDIGFNDQASSVRVEAGYWLFCTDANFGGECRTFGPGDHRSLPNGMNDRISSGRRLSNDYPYRQNPNWRN